MFLRGMLMRSWPDGIASPPVGGTKERKRKFLSFKTPVITGCKMFGEKNTWTDIVFPVKPWAGGRAAYGKAFIIGGRK